MPGNNRIVIKEAKNKEKYLVVKSSNNKTIVNSETYKTTQGVNHAANVLKRVIKNAVIVDKTKKKS